MLSAHFFVYTCTVCLVHVHVSEVESVPSASYDVNEKVVGNKDINHHHVTEPEIDTV